MRSILLFKKLLGLVEMTSGLINVSFSLPEWQTVKMIFFAPWFKTENSPQTLTREHAHRLLNSLHNVYKMLQEVNCKKENYRISTVW